MRRSSVPFNSFMMYIMPEIHKEYRNRDTGMYSSVLQITQSDVLLAIFCAHEVTEYLMTGDRITSEEFEQMVEDVSARDNLCKSFGRSTIYEQLCKTLKKLSAGYDFRESAMKRLKDEHVWVD